MTGAAFQRHELAAARQEICAETGNQYGYPPRGFFDQETSEVARGLLGSVLVTAQARADEAPRLAGGLVVEVEAYLGEDDPACHASKGLTDRTRAFYNRGGTAYVFSAYGIHLCFNVVTLPVGRAGCVLIRALEPRFGLRTMARRRRVPLSDLASLCSGPGRLTQALGILKQHTGLDVTQGPILMLTPEIRPPRIAVGPRVGISVAKTWPLRYWVHDSEWVSA